MMAAKSRMRTMLNSSPWITAVTSLRFFRTDRGHLPGTEQLAPRQKLQRGDDRQQADGDKDREFCHEGLAVEVIVRPFLEIEHPQQPDDEQRTGGDAEHPVGGLKFSRRCQRQFLTDQRKLDGYGGNQREGADMVEEGEQGGHGADSPFLQILGGGQASATPHANVTLL